MCQTTRIPLCSIGEFHASARENFSPRARVEREAGAYAIASIKCGGTPKIYLPNAKKRSETAS